MSLTAPHPLAAGAHPAEVDGILDDGLLDPAALVGGHHPARRAGGDVEGERRRRADVRCSQPAEQDSQHRVGVGRRAHGGARVGPHPLLVDDDRRREALEAVDIGPREIGHEALHEGAVGLVDHALRLGGDRGEHQRALARPRHPGEHGQAPLGQLDADVLEVVLASALHPDEVVAVGDCRGGRVRARRHRVGLLRSGGCRRTAAAGIRSSPRLGGTPTTCFFDPDPRRGTAQPEAISRRRAVAGRSGRRAAPAAPRPPAR